MNSVGSPLRETKGVYKPLEKPLKLPKLMISLLYSLFCLITMATYPIMELSSSFVPRASKTASSFSNLCPAKLLDFPLRKINHIRIR